LRANWNGVVVDFNQGILGYPGGGVVRNKFSDLFRLRYIFQTCYRFHTRFDEIRMITPRNVTAKVNAGGRGVASAFATSSEYGSEQRKKLERQAAQQVYKAFYFLDRLH
jgi:hypothetical protein